eukprot:scaffold253275_cov43-Prasinocladus_malaysianus.AAC.4
MPQALSWLAFGLHLVESVQVAVDIHGGPGQNEHAGGDLLLEVFQVGLEEGLDDREDLLHDAVVLLQDVGQLVEVVLELVLLEQHHAGGLGDLHAHTLQVLGLPHELHDLLVKVDQQLARLWVPHDQRGLQPGLAGVDAAHPGLVPEGLELDQRLGHPVVGLDDALGLLGVHDALVHCKLLHRLLDPPQQLPRPHDIPYLRHSNGVMNYTAIMRGHTYKIPSFPKGKGPHQSIEAYSLQ